MVSKYFRKAGVPQFDESGKPILDESGKPVLGPERSARQVIGRLTGGWRHWGESNGYFATATDAKAFEDELAYMLVHQMAAPNSPQWFNTGLAWAYGITGPAQGHYFVDPADGQVKASDDAYTRPQPHACFIQSANDSLVEPGGSDGPLGARSANLQVRIRNGNEFLGRAWRGGAALGRWHLVRLDELPAGRGSRRGRHQERWHHPPRREDGHRRRRSPGHRKVHQLEGRTRRRKSPLSLRPAIRAISTARRTRRSPGRTRTTPSASARSSWRPSTATKTGICVGEPTRRISRRPSRRATCGGRSRKRRGSALIQDFSSTPRSTTGTPVRRPDASTPVIPVPSTCSSTTQPAIWPR